MSEYKYFLPIENFSDKFLNWFKNVKKYVNVRNLTFTRRQTTFLNERFDFHISFETTF